MAGGSIVTVGGGTGSSELDSNPGTMIVGDGGSGTLNIVGGGSVIANETFAYIGVAAGTGTVNVGGGTGSATWATYYIGVGESGPGAECHGRGHCRGVSR